MEMVFFSWQKVSRADQEPLDIKLNINLYDYTILRHTPTAKYFQG